MKPNLKGKKLLKKAEKKLMKVFCCCFFLPFFHLEPMNNSYQLGFLKIMFSEKLVLNQK